MQPGVPCAARASAWQRPDPLTQCPPTPSSPHLLPAEQVFQAALLNVSLHKLVELHVRQHVTSLRGGWEQGQGADGQEAAGGPARLPRGGGGGKCAKQYKPAAPSGVPDRLLPMPACSEQS